MDDVDAPGDHCRHVESVSWCLAAAHLNDGLLCVDHQSSVTICCMSSTDTGVTLTRLHNVSVDTVPRGHCCVCYAVQCCSTHAHTFLVHHHLHYKYFFYNQRVSSTRQTLCWRHMLFAV